ncbi:MAG: C-GCAxxG-C-C family protein [Oscillospiraceae bacterium]
MSRYDTSIEYFRKGFNCCQSVLLAFSDLTGLDEQTALNISSGYGSGAGTGELCGALNGAIMTLGLLTPVDRDEPVASKRRTMLLAKELQNRFRERFEAVRCRELLANAKGYQPDDRTPAAKEMGLSKHCEIMVVTAVELVEELLAERSAQ